VKPTWLVFAVALAAYLVWRRRRLEPTLLVGGVIVVIGALVYGFGLVHLPNLEELLIDIGERLGKWTYLLVGVLAFVETGAFIGLIAPGETALLLGGLVAGQGQIDVMTMIAIVWFAAVAGDLTSFYLGRRLGRKFLVKHGPKVQITEERLGHVEAFFDRHGGKAILIGRVVGLVRAIAPFLAGSSGLPLRRFVPYDVIGAGLWGSTFVVIGYLFWQSFSRVVDYAKTGALALGTVIVLVVAIVWLVRWQRDPANRARAREWLERQAERPRAAPHAPPRALRVGPRHARRPRAGADHAAGGGQRGRLRVRVGPRRRRGSPLPRR
jgi:membrane protein DedA with SNARE-associated domain